MPVTCIVADPPLYYLLRPLQPLQEGPSDDLCRSDWFLCRPRWFVRVCTGLESAVKLLDGYLDEVRGVNWRSPL